MRFCLLTSAHISYNPRLLKEADALTEAGHDVTVISILNEDTKKMYDQRIVSARKWCWKPLDFRRNTPGWIISGLRQKLLSYLARHIRSLALFEGAFSRYHFEMSRALRSEQFDAVIAHNLQALPAAARAAQERRKTLGFDVEDFHIAEDSFVTADALTQKMKEAIMARYLPECDHLSAPSRAMAEALARRFPIRKPPVVLYNVFPLSYASGIAAPAERNARPLSAYWFSQVVGIDRGLQDFIRAMPIFDRPIDLYLRAADWRGARSRLLDLARSLGVAERLHFLDPVPPDSLVEDAARHDFGLALEQPVSENRLLTVTNKVFTYLLAGLAVIATRTLGQAEIFSQIPEAGLIYEPGKPDELAVEVNAVLRNGTLVALKQGSWKAGRERYNWDAEKQKLLCALTGKFS